MLTGNMQPHLNDVGGGLVNLSHVAHLKNPQVARFLNAYNLDDKCYLKGRMSRERCQMTPLVGTRSLQTLTWQVTWKRSQATFISRQVT